jgi:hypothetical protein
VRDEEEWDNDDRVRPGERKGKGEVGDVEDGWFRRRRMPARKEASESRVDNVSRVERNALSEGRTRSTVFATNTTALCSAMRTSST